MVNQISFYRCAIRLAAFGAVCISANTSFAQSPPLTTDKLNPLFALSFDALQATRERPLFAPSRRPPPPPIVAEAVKPEQPPEPKNPSVTLIGVLYGPNLQIAIFMNDGDKSFLRVHLGDTVLGWTVQGVEPRSVTLEKLDRRVNFGLKTPIQATQVEAMLQDPGISLHGMPVGPIRPFAAADRSK